MKFGVQSAMKLTIGTICNERSMTPKCIHKLSSTVVFPIAAKAMREMLSRSHRYEM